MIRFETASLVDHCSVVVALARFAAGLCGWLKTMSLLIQILTTQYKVRVRVCVCVCACVCACVRVYACVHACACV